MTSYFGNTTSRIGKPSGTLHTGQAAIENARTCSNRQHGSKSLEIVFSIANRRQSGDKWQSKILFLTIFDLRSSVLLTFSIAAYPVCTWVLSEVLHL